MPVAVADTREREVISIYSVPGNKFLLDTGVLLHREQGMAQCSSQARLGTTSLEHSSLQGSQQEHFEVARKEMFSAAETTLGRYILLVP